MASVVMPITRDTFKPYAKLAKSNQKIQGRICELMFRLIQTDDPAKVRQLCKDEIAWLEGEAYSASTRTKFVAAYRKALLNYFDEHPPAATLQSERETVKGTVTRHCALDFLLAKPDDYAVVSEKSKTKTAAQRDNLTGFNAAAAVSATEDALNSDDWRELAAGLIMATQSRPSDMLSSGDFQAVSKYRLEFSSRAKKRGAVAKGEIFCLVDTATFIDAFSRLRREPAVMEMKEWALKDIDSGKNSTINRAVKRVFSDIIAPPFGEDELSCKNLRASGVNVAYWLHGRENQSIGRFAELQLLHDNPGTAANYEDYFCADAEGNRLQTIGIIEDGPLTVQPKSEKRTTITVDTQLKNMIADAGEWGAGSHADRLERIIAAAKRAGRVEAQLAREAEKRQRAELKVARLEKQLAEAQAKPTPAPVAIAQAEAEDAAFDWRTVPNAELNGDRRNHAYPEKLRRSVEAVQEYNAGRYSDEQFAITGSLLRQLTKVKPGLVKEWMEAHEADLNAYAETVEHTGRQNVGKPDPRSVIKWSEGAYGKYEW